MKRVVVGTDGSRAADSAVVWATTLCHDTGADLVVAAAWSSRLFDAAAMDEMERHGRRQLLDGPWSEPARAAGVHTTTEVLEEDAGIGLRRIAEEEDADLVVVGNDREGRPAMAVGSVRDQLIHHLRCPLAAVPEGSWPLAAGTLVVGIDGSRASETALRWAVEVARDLDGEVVAVFVHHPLADSFPHPDLDNWHYPGEDAVRAQVGRVGTSADRIRLVQLGAEPRHGLERVADDVGAAALVVGTRGRGSIHGLLVGRVPSHLVHEASRPVIVVPHPF